MLSRGERAVAALMPCLTPFPGVVVCTPTPSQLRRSVRWCRKCHADRWHVITFYEWYDPSRKCQTCGRREEGTGRRVGAKPLHRWEQRL